MPSCHNRVVLRQTDEPALIQLILYDNLIHNVVKSLTIRTSRAAIDHSAFQRIRRKLEPDRHHPIYVLTEPGVGYWMPLPDSSSEPSRAAL